MATRALRSVLLAMGAGVPPVGGTLMMAPGPLRLPSAAYVVVKTTSVPLAAMPPGFLCPVARGTAVLGPPLEPPDPPLDPLLDPPVPPLDPPEAAPSVPFD